MKPTVLLPLGLAVVAGLIAASPKKEIPPAGAREKIVEALPDKAYAKPASKRKLLVFSRTAGFRHRSIPTGKLALSELGERTGAFEAVISDDLANFEKEALSGFDAVLFLSTTQNAFKQADDSERLVENLLEYIENGGGFVGIHAATDTFYEYPEYGEMIGGYFNGHPWGSKSQVSIMVEPGRESHPLAAMFEGEPLEFKEEIYQFKAPYDSSKVDMLLRLDPENSAKVGGIRRKDQDFGVAWARHWGEGRVFYCSLGHNHHIFWNPKVLRHYLAGIQWAMGDYEAEVSR